ncbi:MAG: hypothetical protein CBC49_010585 [Alphaproteobacteria bacterium TMED89]|nr:MAG: hypothetical protein CBC49_010585 [Alphaproteobacteria bacterium TMED89]
MNPVFRDFLAVCASLFLGVLNAKPGFAQFEHMRLESGEQALGLAAQVCDTSAFPPFNRDGPWRFVLCDGASVIVATCNITASAHTVANLPASMMRRALLRLIENHDPISGAGEGGTGALVLTCELPQPQSQPQHPIRVPLSDQSG